AFGLTAPMFIGLAMLVVFAILAWKKVPAAIAKALDAKIALIRDQLAEAESLRKEAEALKAEYEAKAAAAGSDGAPLPLCSGAHATKAMRSSPRPVRTQTR